MGKNFCKIENKWCKFLKRGVCGYCKESLLSISRCPRLAEIETVRFSEIIKSVEFGNVFPVLCRFFSDQEKSEEGYREVFDKLRTMVPKKHKLDDMFIVVEKGVEDGREYLDVHGVELGKDVRYGIEFCPWLDWVSMYVTRETLDNLSNEEIVAGCLFEMTFFGFTEERVENKRQELIESVGEMKENKDKK